MAVRLVILLFECSLVELLQAEGTDKMLRVELAVHGSDAASCDRFATASTEGPTFGMIMGFTVRHSIVVKK